MRHHHHRLADFGEVGLLCRRDARTTIAVAQERDPTAKVQRKKRTVMLRERLVVIGVVLEMSLGAVGAEGPFEANWESLKAHETPAWYLDGKFGIFIHWGAYSVPAFGSEWYPRNMYKEGTPEFKHHLETYGPQSQFGYKDFIPSFRAEKFDAAAWAELFKRAGARYVVPVAEHHDGFQMYDSALSDFNAKKMGPKRDIVGELAAACREQGLVFGVSSHRAEHWWFYDQGMTFDSDVRSGKWDKLYGPAQPEKSSRPNAAFLEDWYARCVELVDKYQPQLFWFDWWIEQPEFVPYLQKFAAHYYNRGAEFGAEGGKGVAINYKNKAFPAGVAVLDIERGKLGTTQETYWQTDTSVSVRSWGYIEKDRFRDAGSLIHELADIVSKNGCLLLNLGPRPDGTIPEQAQAILLEMGRWLDVNGEAIYGTRPWTTSGEGPTQVKSGSFSDHKESKMTAEDVRFTTKGQAIYAIAMGWPEKAFRIESLGKKSAPDLAIRDVKLLGRDKPVKWSVNKDCLKVLAPKEKPCDHAYVIRIELGGWRE